MKAKYFHLFVAFGKNLIEAIDCAGFVDEVITSKKLHKFYFYTMFEAQSFSNGVMVGNFYNDVNPVKTYIIDYSPRPATETIDEKEDTERMERIMERSFMDCY